MTEHDLTGLTLADAAAEIQGGGLSPVELTELMLARIERLNPELVAYVTVAREEALADARAAEAEIRDGKYRGPLHGISLSIKDNIATRGIRTTAGSKVLEECVPDYDATVVARLRAAGAVILGKTNMHEWANGGTTINPFYGTTRNPWDTERIAGGSSGGSAAGLAASLCLGSIGTDNGGSVRNPASLCGTVGFKPTYGRISRFGHVPGDGGFSTNHLGVFSKTVRDCALILQAVAGKDPKDPNSADEPVPDYKDGLDGGIEGLRVGIVKDYFDRYMTRAVREAFTEARRQLESLGATLVEVGGASPGHDTVRLALHHAARERGGKPALPDGPAARLQPTPAAPEHRLHADPRRRLRRRPAHQAPPVPGVRRGIRARGTSSPRQRQRCPAPTIEESERGGDGSGRTGDPAGEPGRELPFAIHHALQPHRTAGPERQLRVLCRRVAHRAPDRGAAFPGGTGCCGPPTPYEQAAGWFRRTPPVG